MKLHRNIERIVNKPKIGLLTAAALSAVVVVPGSAAALPTSGLAVLKSNTPTKVENVLWVCRWHRCWWIPPLAYYPPPPFIVFRSRPHWWHRR
jgi:hypothetical protein